MKIESKKKTVEEINAPIPRKIEEYIRNQLKEDRMAVQLSIDFDGDPFDG